jgi:hypothetical protein
MSMDSASPTNRSELLGRLRIALKAGVGGLVIASATVTSTPAQAATADETNSASIVERAAEIRQQILAANPAASPDEPASLMEWGNWHNWHNGWHNGWHNWHNWHNW